MTQKEIEELDDSLQIMFDKSKTKTIGLKKGTPNNEETEPIIATKHLCDLEIKKRRKF